MKKQYKISLIILGLILLFAVLVALIPNLFKTEIKMSNPITQLGKKAYEVNGSANIGKQSAGKSHNASMNKLIFEFNSSTVLNKVGIPVDLYCIQHGTGYKYNPNYKSKDYVKNAHNLPATRIYPGTDILISNSYYECSGKHEDIGGKGAYIVTQPSNIVALQDDKYRFHRAVHNFTKGENISKEVRQIAIWMTPEVINGGDSPDPEDNSDSECTFIQTVKNLLEEADSYQKYEDILNENVDNPIKETTDKKVKVNVNSEEQYLIVGPYKMDYVDGIADSVAFSGISNITVKGYKDKNKTEFIKNVEILSYIQNAEEKSLVFFKPTENEGYVDRLIKLEEMKGKDENGEEVVIREKVKTLSYPSSGKEFYLKIKNPNQGVTKANERVNYIDIEVEYQYMTVNGTKCELDGKREEAKLESKVVTKTVQGEIIKDENGNPVLDEHGNIKREPNKEVYDHTEYKWLESNTIYKDQDMMSAWGERNLYKLTINLTGGNNGPIPLNMSLGGYVWEDVPAGKESTTDGKNGILDGQNQTGDRAIPNVKVTLYECPLDANGNLQYSNGQLVKNVADLLSDVNKSVLTDEEISRRINPQLTDSNGYYQFDGLDASNKYYVAFEYNGQVYLPTDYLVNDKNDKHYNSVQEMVNAKLYNTDIWRVNSKGTEIENDRKSYNDRFAEIGSSPLNYVSSNSLNSGKLVRIVNDYYNETFSQYELMGFVLDGGGSYSKDDKLALIDGFYKIEIRHENGKDIGYIVETNTLQEGIISKKIKEYIKTNKKYPDDEAMKSIYTNIVNSYPSSKIIELWRKLQFIEDCKITAHTGSPFKNGAIDLYPVYDDFTINNTAMVIPGVGTKSPIYDGQYYVNLGLWRRQETDLALRKDILYAAAKINGKTEIYKYDKRAQITQAQKDELKRLREIYENNGRTKEDYDKYLAYKNQVENSTYWEIQLRVKDYNNYYGTYLKEIYPADYSYRKTEAHNGDELELYVTYRITVRNTSQSVLTEVKEIVDYYDKDYTYIDDLSWVMYGDNEEISIKEEDYHDTINAYINKKNFKGNLKDNAKDVDCNYSTTENSDGTYTGNSRYNATSHQDLEYKYNTLYVKGLDGRKLESGEEAYVYLTFRVNKDNNGIILDEDDSMKQNYAEINGYSTYYKDNTKLPNNKTVGSNDSAGFIDINSKPGNLTYSDTLGEKAEKNFENDTDRAKSIKVTVNSDFKRSINGTVWEDQRTQTVANSVIGDGVRKEEIGISGVTVQLIEKLANGREYVWETTTTDKNGRYEFKTYSDKAYIIPGNYIVRFQYGNTNATVVPSNSGNKVSYNGQDFKSTVYQKDMKNNKEVSSYNYEYYDIGKADAFGENLSDAKDVWSIREEVNKYSSSNVTNHVAEVLASPYNTPNDSRLINELIENTKMTAETGIIVLEGEYNRTKTDGDRNTSNGADAYRYGNDKNGSYTINNVDLGLTERPKAQLELDKKVANVKITLADGSTLFDTSKRTKDLSWINGSAYELDNKMSSNKYNEYYNKDHRYAYMTQVDKLVSGKYNSSGDNGLIQATMVDEIMHGATITISYDLTVTNVGETDYEGKDFYYKGTNTSRTVTTKADIVLDYVANNLQFRANDNNGWSVINKGNAQNSYDLNFEGVNTQQVLNKFNTIIKTEGLDEALTPGRSTTKRLVLTQLITPENTSDDKTYNNIAEITTISNSVGRRMAYSIQGNQDPTTTPAEVDSSKSERVVILPPFGIGQIVTYVAVAVGALVILTVGIIFIKKKVLKK